MEKIDINAVKSAYDIKKEIWPITDKWHYYTYQRISSFLKKYCFPIVKLQNDTCIINLGSGGNPYCFPEDNMLHVDITDKQIKNKPKYLVGNVEHLEVQNNSYDIGLCVGSVINYADAFSVIKELSRVVKKNGWICLEFENSKSFEFYGTPSYNANACIISTFYQGENEKVWIYSEKFIMDILKQYHFKIIRKKRFHILSPLAYRMLKNSDKATNLCYFDQLLQFLPYSSNVILLAKKSIE